MSDEGTIQDVGFFTRARAIEEAARYIHQHFTLAGGTAVEVGVVVYQVGDLFFISDAIPGESDSFIPEGSMGIRPLPGGFVMGGARGIPVAFVHSHPRPGSLPHMSANDRALGRKLFGLGSGPFVVAAVDANGETWLKEFAGRTLPNGAPADVGGKGSRFGNANNPVTLGEVNITTLGEVTIVGRPPETTSGGPLRGNDFWEPSEPKPSKGGKKTGDTEAEAPQAEPSLADDELELEYKDGTVTIWNWRTGEERIITRGTNPPKDAKPPKEEKPKNPKNDGAEGGPPETTGEGDESSEGGTDERVDPTGDADGSGDSRPGQFHPNYLTMDARMMLAMADLAWRRGQGARPPSGGPTDIWQPFKGKTSSAAPEVARSRGRMLEKSAFMDAALLGALGKQGSHGPSDGSDQIPLTRTVGDDAEAEAAANRDDVRRMLWKKHVEPRILSASQRTRRTG